MLGYRHLWPLIKLLPPESAHAMGLTLLRLPIRFVPKPPDDPFTWSGLTFRNRIGIAAGFDKNAACVRGIERLGAGFLEVGTILISPWQGNPVRPRMKRLIESRGIWNRLGFTSQGLTVAAANLAGIQRERRNSMVIACNIGPHPGHLKQAGARPEALDIVRNELIKLVNALYREAELFVVNLSSPNTPGLRSLLQDPELAQAVLLPLRDLIRRFDTETSRSGPMPLLVKLPPEDQNREPWTDDSLKAVLHPLLEADACNGFVAVNTSTRLAQKLVTNMSNPDLRGGVSGEPLRSEALRFVKMVRNIIGRERLLIGCGGVMEPQHAHEFLSAGADLVEVYSGMIYAGPGLIGKCVDAIRVNH
jgi:dihydroorotate dehydrogenase